MSAFYLLKSEVRKMKLAEALNLRADLQRRIQQLKNRLINNAKVQEGDQPAESPEELLVELEECCKELEIIMVRINLTNASARNKDGKSITELIAAKDCLVLKLAVVRDFLENASKKVDRYAHKEIRVLSSVNVREMQKQADAMAKELRQIDTELQQINWNTDLAEG